MPVYSMLLELSRPRPRGQEVFAVLGERLEPTLEDLDRLPHLRACLQPPGAAPPPPPLPRGPHPAPPPSLPGATCQMGLTRAGDDGVNWVRVLGL